MKLDRESRRTIAQFLNGLALALLSALVLVPMADGSLDINRAVAGALAAVLLHAAATMISAG